MTNHFHLLVEVPPKMDQELSDEALINRLSLLYSKDYVGQVGVMLRELAERNKRTDNLRGNGLLSVMCWLLFTYG
jgi:REP element-mobilizing transposase RayT